MLPHRACCPAEPAAPPTAIKLVRNACCGMVVVLSRIPKRREERIWRVSSGLKPDRKMKSIVRDYHLVLTASKRRLEKQEGRLGDQSRSRIAKDGE